MGEDAGLLQVVVGIGKANACVVGHPNVPFRLQGIGGLPAHLGRAAGHLAHGHRCGGLAVVALLNGEVVEVDYVVVVAFSGGGIESKLNGLAPEVGEVEGVLHTLGGDGL